MTLVACSPGSLQNAPGCTPSPLLVVVLWVAVRVGRLVAVEVWVAWLLAVWLGWRVAVAVAVEAAVWVAVAVWRGRTTARVWWEVALVAVVDAARVAVVLVVVVWVELFVAVAVVVALMVGVVIVVALEVDVEAEVDALVLPHPVRPDARATSARPAAAVVRGIVMAAL